MPHAKSKMLYIPSQEEIQRVLDYLRWKGRTSRSPKKVAAGRINAAKARAALALKVEQLRKEKANAKKESASPISECPTQAILQ